MLAVALSAPVPASAGPAIAAGDSILRHDILVLADHGILPGPVSTWPLAWGPIVEALGRHEPRDVLPPGVAASLERVRQRARRETRTDATTFDARAAAAHNPVRIRSFHATPREEAEAGIGGSWTGDRFAATVKVQLVERSAGDADVRVDGSQLGVALGNWTLSAHTLDRWWGPGWDASIILSNNARPFPVLSLDRNFTDAFDTPWLRWIGPWDLNVMVGQLESSRHVPDARFLGMRINFRPLPTLEIGLSRTAQWCGEGRPCGVDVLTDLLLGRDNIGDDAIGDDNEPGNQLAGFDFRWVPRLFGGPVAFYAQLIGEDEAGGFPSRYLGQFGVEASGSVGEHWSWRAFGEFAGTSCQFHESSERFNCGYNHSIYRTGYRYRGRPIGHGADNDARLYSAGLLLAGNDGTQWRLTLRDGELNRGGLPDVRNTISAVPADLLSIDVAYRRTFRYGIIEIGAGYESFEQQGDDAQNDGRVFVEWTSGY